MAVAEATVDPEEAHTDRPAITRLILIFGCRQRHPKWGAVVFDDYCQGSLILPVVAQFDRPFWSSQFLMARETSARLLPWLHRFTRESRAGFSTISSGIPRVAGAKDFGERCGRPGNWSQRLRYRLCSLGVSGWNTILPK